MDISLLQCPACRHALRASGEALACQGCSVRYMLRGDVPIFVPQAKQQAVSSHQQKPSALRRIGKLLTPPHHSAYFDSLAPSYGEGRELKEFLRNVQVSTVVLNIGSLSMSLKALHPGIVNLDISEYQNVDVVADAHALPFKDASIDVVLFKNVLEHVHHPMQVLAEIHRVLKPGGILYAKIPFLQPFHAVPDDYQRYTVSGIAELFEGRYDTIRTGIAVGPSSMLSWILREYLAVLTSFGNMRAYQAGLLVWGWFTFWVKWLDILFRRNRLSNRLASAFYGFYRKKPL